MNSKKKKDLQHRAFLFRLILPLLGYKLDPVSTITLYYQHKLSDMGYLSNK